MGVIVPKGMPVIVPKSMPGQMVGIGVDENEEPLPQWFSTLRPGQVYAIERIVEEFEMGKKLVVFEGPTGAGKTLIAEMVRRRLGAGKQGDARKTSYVCSGKELQRQFMRDFPYARLLQGRGNYGTVLGPSFVTAADCQKAEGSCQWCPSAHDCPYEVAKTAFMNGTLGCLNTAYALYEWNYPGRTRGRGLTVVDECDELEGQLLNFVEFRVPQWMVKKAGLRVPPAQSRYETTIVGWLEGELREGLQRLRGKLRGGDVREARDRVAVERVLQDAARVAAALRENHEAWIRDNEAGPMVLKPVSVQEWGGKYLWPHGDRWLLMSATVVDEEQMVRDLGWLEDGEEWKGVEWGERPTKEYGWVRGESEFPAENRPVLYVPVARLTRKSGDREYEEMVEAAVELVRRHEGQNTLVHAVSYKLTKFIVDGLRSAGVRNVHSYTEASGRSAALERFKREGGVLVAPSMDRGIDLPDELCRVQIICKVPYPNLGDKQVSAKVHSPGGRNWYRVQTVRTVVQMTGRGVRHREDEAVTYILDKQWGKVWRESKGLFPQWWKDAYRLAPKSEVGLG